MPTRAGSARIAWEQKDWDNLRALSSPGNNFGLDYQRSRTTGKAHIMLATDSLSVVLSVENAQNWIARDIVALIDCLADLTGRFEIIVVDNASRDYTIEVLEDLRSRFPQVSFRRFAERRLMEEAVDVGLQIASGEFVFTASPGTSVEPNELRRLWALRIDPKLVVARSRTTARRVDAGLINRLTHWAQRVTAAQEPAPSCESFGGLQMIRRQAIDRLAPSRLSAIPASHTKPNASAMSDVSTAVTGSSSLPPNIEISHVSHQQLASPKLVEARRRARSEV